MVLLVGKGGRNHASRYRIVVHSAEYMKKKHAFEKRKKMIRNGEIFTGVEINVPLPHAIVDLFNAIKTEKGVKSD